MSRHRNVRSMNYSDEYDDEDVYGHSVEDDYCISPSDAAQFMYDRSRQTAQISAFFNDNIAEEDETEVDVKTNRRESDSFQRPRLSDLDEAKLASCLEEVRNVIGDSIPESVLVKTILQNNFDLSKSLNAVLSDSPGVVDAPKPQRERKERNRDDELNYSLSSLSNSYASNIVENSSCFSGIKTPESISKESNSYILKKKMSVLDTSLHSNQQAKGPIERIAHVPDIDSSLSETLSNIKLHIPKLQTKIRKDSDKENKEASDDSDMDDSPFSSLAALAKQHSSDQSSLKGTKLGSISSKAGKNIESSDLDDSHFSSLAALAKQHSSDQSILKGTKLSSLSSKAGKNLETSDLDDAPFSSLAALAKQHSSDQSILRGTKLSSLSCKAGKNIEASDLDHSPFSSLTALSIQHSSDQTSLKVIKLGSISSKNIETPNVPVISLYPSTTEEDKLDYLVTKDSAMTETHQQNLNQMPIEEIQDKNIPGKNMETNLIFDSKMPLHCNNTVHENMSCNFMTNNNHGPNQSLQMLVPSLSDIVDGYIDAEMPLSMNDTLMSQEAQLKSKTIQFDKFSSSDLCEDASYSDCSGFLSQRCPGEEENNDLVIDLSCALKDPSRSSLFESENKTSSQVEFKAPELIKHTSPNRVAYLLCNLDSKYLLKKKFKCSAKVSSEFGQILCRRMKPYPVLKVPKRLYNNSGIMKSFQFDTLSPDEEILKVFKKQ